MTEYTVTMTPEFEKTLREKTLHAHVETSSADCDGRYSRDYDVFFNDEETAESKQEWNDFSEIHFMERVMMMVASPYAIRQATVTIDDDGIEVNEGTEEGYRHASVKWCKDDCTDTEKVRFRDHTAESMGY